MAVKAREIFRFSMLLCVFLLITFAANAQDEIRIIVRGDDFGNTHGSLEAFERAFNQGILTSGALQACAPWFEGAADLARKNPQWCVGVHLTLIAEWQGYRWRPVLPWDKVSSIVDEDGYFFAYPAQLLANNPRLEEIEAELRAQIELVRKRGIRIGYLDTHYLSYSAIPGLEEIYTRLAREYDVPLSSRMGERRMPNIYTTNLPDKITTAVRNLQQLQPGLYLWVCHIGTDSPEQNALIHTHPDHIFLNGGVGKHRAAELEALTSYEVKAMIMHRGIKLVSYSELYEESKRK